MINQVPNVAVWNSAEEYVVAAEYLLDLGQLGSAAVLAALACELSLKSFLAKRLKPWTAVTEKGHELEVLFSQIGEADQRDLCEAFLVIDGDMSFHRALKRYSNAFNKLRYKHEPNSANIVDSELVYFARNLCDAVIHLAGKRNE